MKTAKKFFRLFGDTILIKNNATGAGSLHILAEKRMLHLQSVVIDVLDALEMNTSIDVVAARSGRSVQDIMELLSVLETVGAGTFFSRPYYIEKIRKPDPLSKLTLFQPQIDLQKLHVYLNDGCTKDDGHFRQNDILRLKPCEGCEGASREHGKKADLDRTVVTRVIREAAELECQNIVFHVCDPAPLEDMLIELLRVARNVRFDCISVITNSGLSNQILKTIIEVEAQVSFQAYEEDLNYCNLICGCSGALAEIQRSVRFLSEAGRSATLVYLRRHQTNDNNSLFDGLVELGPDKRMTERLVSPACFDKVDEVRSWVADCMFIPDVVSYIVSLERSCMYGQLSLGCDGLFYACPFVESSILGDAKEIGIHQIFEEERQRQYWENRFSSFKICEDCELRLSCKVCPAIREVLLDETDGCILASSIANGMQVIFSET